MVLKSWVVIKAVVISRDSREANSVGSSICSFLVISRDAPFSSEPNKSIIEPSKTVLDTWIKRSCEVISTPAKGMLNRRATFACETKVPLGLPVVPEV
ncbi:hypothetical protein D3C71_1772290 [compost metagenome]